MIHQINTGIEFDDSIPFFEQTSAFQEYAQTVFDKNDYTDMLNLQPDNTCTWVQEQDGLRFTMKRVYINPKHYTVSDHIITIEKL